MPAVSQSVLDALTDVAMPKRHPVRSASETLVTGTLRLPVFSCAALVLGSGAAGFRAAVELKRRGIDVMIATQNLYGGTSACSGSDKQTLHTASGAGRGDDFYDMADALGAGGAMDGDTAYVEAAGSLRALESLHYLGLPLPVDRFGAPLRYQTDHDIAGRATSCGPRTSRLMVKVLAEESARLGVPVVNRCIAASILQAKGKVAGILAYHAPSRSPDNPDGLIVLRCSWLVLAGGGPGELYRDSVYPKHCFGVLGLALEAGITLVNLTESQFGIGTPRDGFPWNLSGTYAQSMPHIYSLGQDGAGRHFLSDSYRTTQELGANIFRKGYQWPFHASRMLDFGSSLIDLAIFRETLAGRKVFMDFQRNPEAARGDQPFALTQLDEDVRAYLNNNDAMLPTPIERLARMNPLAIELYRRYKKDITREPLELALNNQHMNGGIGVDIWGRSSLEGCYAIGEAAGTHGVTRPGGAALNAGQVMGQRCAEHISTKNPSEMPHLPSEIVADAVKTLHETDGLHDHHPSALRVADIARDVQARMSNEAGPICSPHGVSKALAQASILNAAIRSHGITSEGPGAAARCTQWRQMALVSEAVLTALDFYLQRGGGSRGARAICDRSGSAVPITAAGPLEAYRFLAERLQDRGDIITIRLANHDFVCDLKAPRALDRGRKPSFERDWTAFLSGAIYGEDALR